MTLVSSNISAIFNFNLCNHEQNRRAEANQRQQRAAPAAGSVMMQQEERKGSFASARSSSVEELRKVGGTWDLSREPEDKVSHGHAYMWLQGFLSLFCELSPFEC